MESCDYLHRIGEFVDDKNSPNHKRFSVKERLIIIVVGMGSGGEGRGLEGGGEAGEGRGRCLP